MKVVLFAMLALLFSDLPRACPDVPKVRGPWMETGNRHARRRDRKLGRM